jgi:hypothetical protein
MESMKVAAAPTLTESLRSLSAAERLKMLRELVLLCFADGSLKQPLCVTEDNDPIRAYVLARFPRTTQPFPELTPEEEAEIQRRIANRHNAMSHEEFVRRVVRRIRERRGNEQLRTSAFCTKDG